MMPFKGDRSDLNHYIQITKGLGAKNLLDIGSGTLIFSFQAAEHGFEVIGVEPALAALSFAKTKPHAARVRWIHHIGSQIFVS